MREGLFIKKNKERWEKIQQQTSADADETAQDFTRLLDDLAYAKTFYPYSKVTRYINALASRIYLNIYKNRKEETNRLLMFWKYDLPLTLYKHRRVVLFSFVVFMVFFAIGFFASVQDENMARTIMGDEYVDMTEENIENGNPFGVYETGNPFLSWLGLMIHNIRVSFLVFVTGLFCGVPTIYLLGQNAVMVGVFNHFFAKHGYGVDFFMVVFVHGTLELTAIILAGAAGLVLGKSYLFPGTIKRLDAFKQGAKDGVKIMIGLLPVFGLAAFFEGFITRLYNDMSVLTTVVFFASVLFVVWYFILYPFRLALKKSTPGQNEE